MQSKYLRVEVASFPINNYWISKDYLELRTLDPSGRSYPDLLSSWKRLKRLRHSFSFCATNHSCPMVSRQARYRQDSIRRSAEGEKIMVDLKKDPVCSMAVDKNKAEYTSQYGGKTYYFCSQDCKQQFERRPEKFAIAA
jgi:YHS domain-containing protein